MRLAFIGCVEFSFRALEHVLELDAVELVGVVTRRSSPINADFRSLVPLAESAASPYLEVDADRHESLADWLSSRTPDVVYCFGWPFLLSRDVLDVPPGGSVGFHPAALPENRGRHPIIWSLALGLTETASTFFFMDEGADSGDIISQERLPIHESDDAATLYERITATALRQITGFTPLLASGGVDARPQDHSRANSWRKRHVGDGRIDWRMSPRAIYNLVRALTRPYVGAHVALADGDARVWRVERVDAETPPNLEPGKVLGVEGRIITVKCDGGAVRLVDHELSPLPQVGSYL